MGGGGVRSVVEIKKDDHDKPLYVHYLCGKNHKKGKCDVVCTGCGMLGSHKPGMCWKLHPELKPKNMTGGEGRYRERSRDRSRSREKGGEGSKRGREKSPYPKLEE